MISSPLSAILKKDGPIISDLDNSPYDELAEFDLNRDRYHSIYHVEGKYFVPLLDCSHHELFQYAMDHMIHPDDRLAHYELCDPETMEERLANAEKPGVLSTRIRYKLLDGAWHWTEEILVGGPAQGLPKGIVRVYVYDIQSQMDREEGRVPGMRYLERKWSELTGLLSSKFFFADCEKLLPSRTDWAILSIDIENFKIFNDWYGREAGTILLARVGGILKQAAEESGGLAGYLEQDDFVLLTPMSEERIQRIYDDIHNLIVERGTSVGFLPAFGVALMEEGISILDLYDRAAMAARVIKGDFRRRIKTYNPDMHRRTEEEYRILSDFQRGLEEKQVFFCLQPQCQTATGCIVGAESLARWRLPDGTMVPPDKFVPVLEKYGFVTDLDQYIWEEVCAWLHGWIERGHTPLPISVNVSQVDIFTIDVPEYMEYLCSKYQLPRSVLKIEITESAYVSDSSAVKNAVQKLRKLGFVVLMDDFGSGYSSLNMLRKLNVDIIKLDAQFLQLNNQDEDKGVHIIETIVNMAKTMSLPIIVEGVENGEQAAFLADLGCRYIQGYYLYRPMAVADFEKLIGNESMIDTGGFSVKRMQEFQVREFMDQNIYSDAMLNNILGAVAFYSWDGDKNLDIVRYNEQFVQVVKEPAQFHDRLEHIQNYFHPGTLPDLYAALRKAQENRITGASCLCGVYRTDGSLVRLVVRFYYLEEAENGKIFYGDLQDVTEYTTLQNQMRLLSRFASETIIFLQRTNGGWAYKVVVHGLRHVLGLNEEELRKELESGMFYRRVDENARLQLRDLALNSEKEGRNIGVPFRMETADGEKVELFMRTDHVQDEYSKVEYILSLRPRT